MEPQAILTPLTEAAIFLTLVVDHGAEDQVRDVLFVVDHQNPLLLTSLPSHGVTFPRATATSLHNPAGHPLSGNCEPAEQASNAATDLSSRH